MRWKSNWIIRLITPVLLMLVLALPALAHPHAFADTSFLISFDDKGLASIRVHWEFDEMFSAMLLDEFDPNHDGKLSSKEVKTLEAEAFDYLKNFSYFTNIKVQGRNFTLKWVKDFQAWITKGKLVYQFVIPCHVAATKGVKTVDICPYDDTYYTCLTVVPHDAVQLETRPNIEVKVTMTKTRVDNDMLGLVHTTGVRIQFWRQQ